MRLKLALLVLLALFASACSDDGPGVATPGNVIDLYDPCTLVPTSAVSEAAGFPMVRVPSINENADRFRSCRWIGGGDNTDPASIDYLEVNPRPYIDVVLRQTGVDDESGVDVVFAEVLAAGNTRPEPDLVTSDDRPRLADDARRTDTTAWAIKGNRMLIIATSDSLFLDALIASVSEDLLRRL